MSLALGGLLGDKTKKGGYVSRERSCCKVEKWPQSRGSRHRNRSRGDKRQVTGLPEPPALAKVAFPSTEPLSMHSHVIINLKITTMALPPPQTFPDSIHPFLRPLRNPTALTPKSRNPVLPVCTHMCGYVQSPEDTLW